MSSSVGQLPVFTLAILPVWKFWGNLSLRTIKLAAIRELRGNPISWPPPKRPLSSSGKPSHFPPRRDRIVLTNSNFAFHVKEAAFYGREKRIRGRDNYFCIRK